MMQWKPKYFTALIIIVLLLASVLSACSKQSAEGGNSVSNAPAASNSPSAPKDIRILLSHTIVPYAMQYKDSDDVYRKELSRLSGYNLHYEFLGHGADYNQQLTVRFASKDLADLVRTDDAINSSIHPGAVEQGVFYQLNELLDKYGPNIKKKIGQKQWDSPRVSKDGKIYGIPYLNAVPNYTIIYIRQDWLDKLNMPQPKTVDDYLKFFEAVKNTDLNGNGVHDEYGFYVRENLDYSELFFREIAGMKASDWVYRDGKLQPGAIQPEMKYVLRFWKMLYDKGYINPNLFTNKSSDWRAGIKRGKGGMWSHDVPNYIEDWLPSMFVNEKDVKIGMLPGPQGPKGQGLKRESDDIGFVWVIPTTNKHPEEVIKYLDWAYSSPEADKFFAYGIDGYNYTVGADGKINYDAKSPVNADKNAEIMFRSLLNTRKDGRLEPLVLAVDPNAEIMKKGLEAGTQSIYKNDALYMPNLEALTSRPELATGANTVPPLFLDMFSKVITGKLDLDSGFDNFVKDYKRRGGDEVIKQATDWYNKFHNIK